MTKNKKIIAGVAGVAFALFYIGFFKIVVLGGLATAGYLGYKKVTNKFTLK